jgi:hypothetical protein
MLLAAVRKYYRSHARHQINRIAVSPSTVRGGRPNSGLPSEVATWCQRNFVAITPSTGPISNARGRLALQFDRTQEQLTKYLHFVFKKTRVSQQVLPTARKILCSVLRILAHMSTVPVAVGTMTRILPGPSANLRLH